MQPSLFRKGHSLMGKQPQKIDNMAFNIDFNEQDRCVVLTVKVHVCVMMIMDVIEKITLTSLKRHRRGPF